MADGMTPEKLYAEIDVPEWMRVTEELTGLLDDLTDAYEQGFKIAAENAVRNITENGLVRDICIEINCETSVAPGDLKFLMKQIEDIVNRHAEFQDMKATDEDEGMDVTPEDM